MSILQLFKHQKYKQAQVVSDLQIFDLLQWSRSENEWKEECRLAITHYHRWKQTDPKNAAPSLMMYSYVRERLLRHHAQQVVRYYRLIRKNRRELFNHYLKALPPVRA